MLANYATFLHTTPNLWSHTKRYTQEICSFTIRTPYFHWSIMSTELAPPLQEETRELLALLQEVADKALQSDPSLLETRYISPVLDPGAPAGTPEHRASIIEKFSGLFLRSEADVSPSTYSHAWDICRHPYERHVYFLVDVKGSLHRSILARGKNGTTLTESIPPQVLNTYPRDVVQYLKLQLKRQLLLWKAFGRDFLS